MSRAAAGGTGYVGPLPSSSATCEHGDVVFPIDPDEVYLIHCEETVVFSAPIEIGDVKGPVRLCPFHLARYLEFAADEIAAELVARDAKEHVPEKAFVTIDDAPLDIELLEQRWMLHSIDQRGHAHYVRPDEAVVELLPTFEPTQESPFRDTPMDVYFESIRRGRGFAAFAPGISLPTEGGT